MAKTDAEAEAEIGGPFERLICSAELLFSGHRCDPAALDTAMGYGLTKGWKKGDLVRRDGKYIRLREKTGCCTFDSLIFCRSDDVNNHVVVLLWKFEESIGAFKSLIDRDGLICCILCYFDDPAVAATWQPTAENLTASARLAIPIRVADIGTAPGNDALPRSPSTETDEGSAETPPEQSSSAAEGQPSR